MALGPKQMGEAIVRNLKEKTGKSIEEWTEIVHHSSFKEKKEIISFLKKEKGLGHFQAQKVFEHFIGKDNYADPSSFADEIFSSKKTKTLYDFARTQILEIGSDIKIQPCKTYIPFYRKNQFAILTKGTKDSVVLGLNLPEEFRSSKFSNTSSKGSERINAETQILSESDFDKDVLDALSIAYKNN